MTVTYDVNNNDGDQPFAINVYRSSVEQFDPSNLNQVLIAQAEVSGSDAANGSQHIDIYPASDSAAKYTFLKNLGSDPAAA